MRFRKLRIAFSAVCGMICLLLVALWVRSTSSRDMLIFTIPGSIQVQVFSKIGRTNVSAYKTQEPLPWGVRSKYMSPGRRQVEELLDQKQKRFDIYFAEDDPAMYGFAAPHWFLVLLSAS